MPTIIDSLLVELGLDSSKFDKGRKDADVSFKKTKEHAEQTAKDIEGAGKKSAAFFTQLKKEAAELFILFESAKGLAHFVEGLKDGNAALGRTAKTLGVSTEELSKWQAVAKIAGGTAEGITGVMQAMSASVASMQATGDTSMIPFLNALHLQIQDVVNHDFPKIAEAAAAVAAKFGPATAKLYLQGIHITDEATINLLLRGRPAVEKYLDEVAKLGPVTREDARAAQEWLESSERLSVQLHRLGTVVGTVVEPAFKAFNDRIIESIENSKKYTEQDWEKIKPIWERIKAWWTKLWGDNNDTYMHFLDRIKNSGPDVLSAYKEAFRGVFELLKEGFNKIWFKAFGHNLFDEAVSTPAPSATPERAPDSRSSRNHNPGNIKYGPGAISHGAVGKDAEGFAIFPNDAAGEAAQRGLWNTRGYSDMPIGEALSKWSAGDYNSLPGVDASKKWSELDAAHQQALLEAQKKREGWSPADHGGAATGGPVGDPVGLAMPHLGQNISSDDMQTYLRTGGHPDPQKAAWCAMLVGASLTKAGIKDSGSDLARSYANWGSGVDPKSGVKRNDILVKMNPGQIHGHVGLLTGLTRYVHGILQGEMIAGNSAKEVRKTWERLGGSNMVRRAAIMQAVHTHLHQKRLLQDNHATHNNSNNTHTSSVNVGNVHVNTAATDARGIAADVRGAVEREFRIGAANYGLA